MRFLKILTVMSITMRGAFGLSTGRDRVSAESPHFEISCERSKSFVLPEAAAWLESAYARESQFFDFQTDRKTRVVLLDEEDVSNGFTYAANQWIVIYLAPDRFQLRGATSWLPDVCSHELAHILTLRKMGITRRFLGLDVFGSWDVRPGRAGGDAIWTYGDAPAWLAEGLAQYGSMQCGYDTLDSHREMLLRQAWTSGALLNLKTMENYSQDARASEMIYNQGFHLVNFLYRRYGRDAMNTMLADWHALGYNAAFEKAFGASPAEIYRAWHQELDRRFSQDATPVRTSRFEAPYSVETSPVFDTATGTLFYLSSAANDFGETHLYSQSRSGARTLIFRDVDPPLHLTADGNLIFPSTHIVAGTGARISDLYEYVPKRRAVERLTSNQRAIAGLQTRDGNFYAILQNAGRSRIAQLRNGKPADWVEAPDNTEFVDLAPGNDTTLFVTLVRGNNSDIFGLNPVTGILRPVLATSGDERDPFFDGHRLYFSSDASGEYSVFSLAGDTLRRHTPPGTPAFTPNVRGDTLRFSAYTHRGFQLEAVPIDSGIIESLAGVPANRPFITPLVPPLQRLGFDQNRIELLGYAAEAGYARVKPYAFYDTLSDTVAGLFRLNPCANQGFLGAEGVWTDPDQRNSLSASFVAGQCLDASPWQSPYLPSASVAYLNRDFAPDLFITAQYQGAEISAPDSPPTDFGTLGTVEGAAGAEYHFSDEITDAVMLEYQGLTLNLSENASPLSGVGIGAGNALGFAQLDPGVDFINQGVEAGLGGFAFTGGTLLGTANADLYANLRRFLFMDAHLFGEYTAGNQRISEVQTGAAAHLRLPLDYSIGTAGYRGLCFEALFINAGMDGIWSNRNLMLSQTALRPLANPLFTEPKENDSPLPYYLTPAEHWNRVGAQIKVITPSSQVTAWTVEWRWPSENWRDGTLSASLAF